MSLANDWPTKNGNCFSKTWGALPHGKQVYPDIWAGPVVSVGHVWVHVGRWGAGCFTWRPLGSHLIAFASFSGHVVTGWPFLQINYHETRSWRTLWPRSLQSLSVIWIMSRLLLPLTQSHPQADPLNSLHLCDLRTVSFYPHPHSPVSLVFPPSQVPPWISSWACQVSSSAHSHTCCARVVSILHIDGHNRTPPFAFSWKTIPSFSLSIFF